MKTAIRTTWDVRFIRDDDDEWTDMQDYSGRIFRPQLVEVQVIRQPASIDQLGPQVYHITVRGPRVLGSGELSQVTSLERGWAWRMAGELPEGQCAPGWLIELGEQALAEATGDAWLKRMAQQIDQAASGPPVPRAATD